MKPLAPMALLVLIVGGCGSDEGLPADTGTTAKRPPFTARFVELTDHTQNGKHWRDTAHGAFDWDARKGWVEMRSGKAASLIRIVQLGDVCFRRSEKAAWKQSRQTNPPDSPYQKGLCDFEFRSPRIELRFLHAEVGECCPDKVHVLGLEEVGGVPTTHYSASLGEIGLTARKDIWIDESGAARRTHETYDYSAPDDDHGVTTRTYYDFGAEVKVAPPLAQDG